VSTGWDWLLTALLNRGHTLLAVSMFLAGVGIPLPATMLLVAAGAFSRQGVLAPDLAVLAATSGVVAGDACGYLMGRFALRLLPAAWLASQAWRKADLLFTRWGAWGVFLTRFLITPAATPVNLMAGSVRYGWVRFLALVLVGEILWVLLFGALGHFFAAQWESMASLAANAIGVLVGVVLVLLGWYAWRR